MIDVNPLFIIVFFIYFFNGYGSLAVIAYLSAFIHEISHIIVAYFFGVKLRKFQIHCWGFCASFESLDSLSFKAEALIAIAGPLSNLLIIIFSILFNNSIHFSNIITINFYMLILNLLPVHPLDGGRILKSFFINELNLKHSKKIIDYISLAVIGTFIISAGFQIINDNGNYSLIIAFIYILSQSTVGESNKELLTYRNISDFKGYKCSDELTLGEVVLKTGINNDIILILVDKENKVSGFITGENVKEAALNNKYNNLLKDLL